MLPLHQACMVNSDYFLKCLQFSSWFRTSKLQRLLLVHAESLQLCPTLCDPLDCSLPGFSVHGTVALYPARLLFPWDSPGNNTGVGCHFLQGSSQPRDQICVSCLLHLMGGSFTTSATWETLLVVGMNPLITRFKCTFSQRRPGFYMT